MRILITGSASGLGKHLAQSLGGASWNRTDATSWEQNPDVIIHCAWPARPPQTSEGLFQYFEDTLELTKRLVQLPHRKFIFLSTAEVYPLDGHSGAESQPIQTSAVRNVYAACKLIAESIVDARSRKPLILRSTGLLGFTARPSSLIRILKEDSPALSLTAESRFYYILHRDVEAFIRLAIEQDLTGIYNVSSSKSITLGEAAAKYNRRVRWGSYTYDIGRVDNQKIAAILPSFGKTSLEVIEFYLNLVKNNG